jgi:hypothetical protein
MTQEQQALIGKATSRKNLGRGEQRQLGLMLQDALKLSEYQSKMIKEMRAEIIRLKILKGVEQ